MTTKTQQASMRWRLVVYKNKNPYPITEIADEATAEIVERGVTHIAISRSKGNPDGVASVAIVGPLNSAIFHGNWVIIRSRVGAFAFPQAVKDGNDPASTEGIPRFIGQIDSVQSNYSIDPSTGLITQMHRIKVREWSHVFRQTIKYDLFDLAQLINPTAFASTQSAVSAIQKASINPDAQKSLSTIAKSVTNPFEYVTIALSMVSGINKNASDRIASSNSSIRPALDAATFYSNIATKMPSIPKKLLTDMGLPDDADPDRPFASDASLALVLLGNQKPGIGGNVSSSLTGGLALVKNVITTSVQKPSPASIVPTFKDAPSGTFNGVFSSEQEIQNSFKVPQDRPVMYGSLADFSQEFDLWSLISTRCDPDINELFTDIWYHKDPKNPDLVVGRPVLVMRDKPFLLDSVREKIGSLKNSWSSFDDLPKVYIPDSLISEISTMSTFNGAPNYTRVNVRDPMIKDDSTAIAQAQVLGRSVNVPAQVRYGGMFFSVDSPYFAQAGSNPPQDYSFDTSWYSDIGKLMKGWYGTRFYFPSGNLTLKDNNIPIMVGCNIVFKVGNEATYVAHVDSVDFQHTVSPRGDLSTSTNISFSYLSVYEDGKAFLMGSASVQNLYVKSKESLPSEKDAILSLLGVAGGDDNIAQAQKAIAGARKLEKLLGDR